MPTTAVEVLHDDGRWYPAQLLGQHRHRATGEWRCGVRYTVAVGAQYQSVVWADQCRRLPAEGPPPALGWRSQQALPGPCVVDM